MPDRAVVSKRGEGTALWMLGSLYDVKATAEATGGALTAVEMTIPANPASTPPPHRHNGGEAVYVLEGMVRFHVEDRTVDAGPGTFAFFPEGTLEYPETIGNAPAKILVIYTGGAMDKFFTEVAEPATSRTLPPPPKSPPDIARLVAAAKRHGLDIQMPTGH